MGGARSEDRGLSAAAALVLASLVAVGLGVRLNGLERLTLTHAEVYVPRLAMPAWVSAPPPRESLAESVLGTLRHDNHPPGYYAAMWAWTGLAGTGLGALRLPSALAGAASIALLFTAVRPRDGTRTALLAAALLALHGHHLYWSQQARMWVFLGLCGVASLVLLQALERRPRTGTALAWAFALACGLWLDYSFWPFVAAQCAWLAFRHCDAPRAPAALSWACLAVVSAAPVLAFLGLHLGLDQTGYLARVGFFDHLTGFLLMQWLVPGPPAGQAFGPLASGALLVLLAAATALLAAGIWAGSSERAAPPRAAPPVPAFAWIAAAGLPAVFGAWLFAQDERAAGAASAALPWALLALSVAAGRSWPWASASLRKLRSRDRLRRVCEDPAVLHALAPVAVLLAISLVVPSVAARSLLFVTPFALWLVARGLSVLCKGPTAWALATAALLAAGVFSVRQYSRGEFGEIDYQSLAAAMRPLLRESDTVLIHDAWWTQPMHYYLPPDRFRTRTYAAPLPADPGSRVWVVVLDPKDASAFEAAALDLGGFERGRRVKASGSYAVLLERAAEASRP